MISLYEHVLSPYSQKVKISLREKGLAFEIATPGGIGSGATAGEFAEGSPRGEVPLLVDDETRIFNSSIILEYIEDSWPSPAMLPHGAAERARVRMLEEVMDTHFEAITWAMGEVSWFQRAVGDDAERLRATAAGQIAGFYGWLERQLGERDWFNGSAFGWGDLCVVPFVAGAVGSGFAIDPGSNLAAWFERTTARPSVAQTIAESRAFDRGTSNVAEAVAAGLFKREYRDHRLEWMMKSGGADIVMKGLEAGNIRFAPDFR